MYFTAAALWNWTTAAWLIMSRGFMCPDTRMQSFLHGKYMVLKKKLQSVWQSCPFPNRRVRPNSEINYTRFLLATHPSGNSRVGRQHTALLPNDVRTRPALTKCCTVCALIWNPWRPRGDEMRPTCTFTAVLYFLFLYLRNAEYCCCCCLYASVIIKGL